MKEKTFAYIWEYRVRNEFLDQFERIYGPSGEWVQLFRKAARGYRRTELHQDHTDPTRYLTVDYWDSKSDRDAFRKDFDVEFELLDQQCGKLTHSEMLIGDFDCFD